MFRSGHTDALLVSTLALERKLYPDIPERKLAELTHRVLHPGRYHEVLRTIMLQDQPHALHIVLRITPVTKRRKVPQVQLLLLPLSYTRRCKRDLPRHERLAPALALMVEKDPRAAVHPVCLAVLLHYPVAVELRHRIRAVRMERRVLVLRNLLHLTVKLRRGRLVDPAGPRQPALTHSLQDPQNACRVHVRRELRRVEAHLHMALRRKVVYLVRTHLPDHLDDAHRVPKIRIMQMEMRPALQVRYPLPVVHRRAPYRPVDFISFPQQKLGQERSVLAGDTCD